MIGMYNMDTIIVAKFVSLVFSIWFGTLIFGRIIYRVKIYPLNFIIFSVSLATFIFIQFNLFV